MHVYLETKITCEKRDLRLKKGAYSPTYCCQSYTRSMDVNSFKSMLAWNLTENMSREV